MSRQNLRCCVVSCALLLSVHVASAQDRSPALGAAPTVIDARNKRQIVFRPDRPAATLEMHGLAIVNGIWIEGWLPLCTGACITSIPNGSRYRVSGSGVRTSRELTNQAGAEPLRLQVTTGAAWTAPVGIVATSVGGVAIAGGFVAWGMAGLCALNDEPHSCDSQDAQQTGGGIVMALGAATLVTGLVLLATSRTTVDVFDDAPPLADIPGVQLGRVRLTPRGMEF